MIFYLIYFSKAVTLSSDDYLEKLLMKSRFYNKTRGITGLLVYVEGMFLNDHERQLKKELSGRFIQVIEGDESEVRALYALIEHDPAHENVILLKEGLLDRRGFEDWAMGFHKVTQTNPKDTPGFVDLDAIFLSTQGRAEQSLSLKFLNSFYQMAKSKK